MPVKKRTTNEFIEIANVIHNNKYDYSKTKYKGSTIKVYIVCPIHGKFKQKPVSHLEGKGCKKCGNNKDYKRSNLQKFIEKSNKIHNYKYDYSLSIYINSKTKLIIICKKHGQFDQSPNSHLSGHGCLDCGFISMGEKGKISIQEFIKRANKIHNSKYIYTNVIYEMSNIDVKIICPIHGVFPQTPHNHLKGQNCPKCTKYISKLETDWLDYLDIPKEYRQKFLRINGKKFKFDAYDPNTKTVYEFYGDFWHGNPAIYNQIKINPKNKKSYGELYSKTIEKELIIKSAGYKLISIWEIDWKNHIEWKHYIPRYTLLVFIASDYPILHHDTLPIVIPVDSILGATQSLTKMFWLQSIGFPMCDITTPTNIIASHSLLQIGQTGNFITAPTTLLIVPW